MTAPAFLRQSSFDALLSAPPAERRAAEPEPLSVSELNRRAGALLEERFSNIYVLGEISGFLNHRSGHWYFNLKDAGGQVACACFKGSQRGLSFRPEDGQQVIVRGRLTIYEPRGAYQLVVDHLQPAGAGALQQRFDALKAKLASEGLFAEERKRRLPQTPRAVALVTSTDGAAVRDFIRIAVRRYPAAHIIVVPTRVQGPGAAEEIAQAIDLASNRASALGIDVIVATRGGGSMEDLWAFNEEVVVRALARATVPTVSAIGHEIDVTLSDFVADVRAPTPSAAAELCVPDLAFIAQRLALFIHAFGRAVKLRIARVRARLSVAQASFRDPSARLLRRRQHLDELEARLQTRLAVKLEIRRERLRRAERRLEQNHPRHRLGLDGVRLKTLLARICRAASERAKKTQQRLTQSAARLDALSPLAVLGRGYAVVLKDGAAVRRAHEISAGDHVDILLHEGKLEATVTRCVKDA